MQARPIERNLQSPIFCRIASFDSFRTMQFSWGSTSSYSTVLLSLWVSPSGPTVTWNTPLHYREKEMKVVFHIASCQKSKQKKAFTETRLDWNYCNFHPSLSSSTWSSRSLRLLHQNNLSINGVKQIYNTMKRCKLSVLISLNKSSRNYLDTRVTFTIIPSKPYACVLL